MPSLNEVDPDVKNERTREFTACASSTSSFQDFAVGATYIHRIYDRFRWNLRIGETADMWIPREWTAADAIADGNPIPAEGLPQRRLDLLRVRSERRSFRPT